MKKEEEGSLLWRRRTRVHFYEEEGGSFTSMKREGEASSSMKKEGEASSSMRKEGEAWSMAMELCCIQEEEKGRGALQEKLAWQELAYVLKRGKKGSLYRNSWACITMGLSKTMDAKLVVL